MILEKDPDDSDNTEYDHFLISTNYLSQSRPF